MPETNEGCGKKVTKFTVPMSKLLIRLTHKCFYDKMYLKFKDLELER